MGRLTAGDWERLRLHPYLSERMLCASPALAPLGTIAGRHHERLNGSGYVQHIYSKAGVSDRGQASLFAVKHGLLSDLSPLAAA